MAFIESPTGSKQVQAARSFIVTVMVPNLKRKALEDVDQKDKAEANKFLFTGGMSLLKLKTTRS